MLLIPGLFPLLRAGTLREDDRGLLWEHMVLDELRSRLDNRNIFYWRDKSGREIDFIVPRERKQIDVVECKINPDSFNIKNLIEFRSIYPEGRNYVVSPFIKKSIGRELEN